MKKSRKFHDFRIKRRVTDLIRENLTDMLTQYIDESTGEGLGPEYVFDAKYLRESLLSKYVDENTDPPALREHRAIVKWLGVEQRNKRTNNRLWNSDPFFKGLGHGQEVLRYAAKLIERTIGRTAPEDLLTKGSFSSGATTSLRRDVVTLPAKFLGRRDTTPEAWEALSKALPSFPLWAQYNTELYQPRFVKGNILFTVPKTALIDRVACKEPDYNVFAQKAVGDFFRRQLRKAGIDLNDQSINRNLAREGSTSGKLATIDLSSASDSLTIALVALLLPREWFLLLDSLRSPKTFIKGLSHKNEMFSSMGNGFTFELESLVFWAIAHSIRKLTRIHGRISVYGDDIIVPSPMAGMLIQFLSWVGFKTNVDKTFIKGPFRESCGGHYYRGNDVTPFYLRQPIKDVSDLILFLNQYRKWIIQTGMDQVDNGFTYKNRFVRFWYNLAAFVPKCLWGGWDLTSRVQLASPGLQQCELLRTTRKWARLETEYGIGLYLSRLSMADRLSFPAEDTPFSSLTTPTSHWSVRRCRFEPYVFGLAKPMFVIEQ